ncbi:hypothetical protein AB6A40_000889 [Gnathostoma spinigerum]|uniref:Uncharacterized protein n=1 Tax=Gnathostoma spinigerum TaxID=75299 RepID=A0ABD6E2Y8_9BILA
MLVVVFSGLLAILCMSVVFFPRISLADYFLNDDEYDYEITASEIRLRGLTTLAFYFIVIAQAAWMMKVALRCHRYFDDLNLAREQRKKRNRNPDANNLQNSSIIREQMPTKIILTEEGFNNPNYGMSDNEDEAKANNPPMQTIPGGAALV